MVVRRIKYILFLWLNDDPILKLATAEHYGSLNVGILV
jgi:hypothetical protein